MDSNFALELSPHTRSYRRVSLHGKKWCWSNMKRVETALNPWFWSSCPWKVGKEKNPQHLFFQSDDCHPPEWCNLYVCLLHGFPGNLGPKNHQANPLPPPPPPPTEMNPSLVDRFCGDLGCVDLASRRLTWEAKKHHKTCKKLKFYLKRHLRTQEQFEFCIFFSDEFIYLSFYPSTIHLPNSCIYLYFSWHAATGCHVLVCFLCHRLTTLSRIQWPVQPKPEGATKLTLKTWWEPGIVINSFAPRSLKITYWWRVFVFFWNFSPFDKS